MIRDAFGKVPRERLAGLLLVDAQGNASGK
jgi:hypothetical protein